MGAAAVQEPAAASPTVEVVGNAFVLQYYHVLHQSPEHVHRFYQEDSKMGRPSADGAMAITTTMEAIKEKILSLDYGELRAVIKTVDAQESFGGGVLVLVTGFLTGKDEVTRNFTQAFFLAPQDNGYFVLNDAFRYVEDVKSQDEADVPMNEIENSPTPNQNTKLEETVIDENSTAVALETVENLPEPAVICESADMKNEVIDAEIVNDTPEILQSSHDSVNSDSVNSTKEVQKKSYASIVKVPSSAPAVAKDKPKTTAKQRKVVAAPVSGTEPPTLSKDAVENGNQLPEEGALGHSIYIKALPLNATPSQVEAEFKQFGPIKRGGVQVRSSKGFCFGFVEFEEASSAQKAIQASPIMIGGHEVFAQEKKSTNSRVNNKPRFPTGRGNGFKNEDDRGFPTGRGNGFKNEDDRGGRGSNGGFRGGYDRGGFNNNPENTSKGNERGGFYNRGGRNGYKKSDNNNDRNTSGVVTNKPTVPRISALA